MAEMGAGDGATQKMGLDQALGEARGLHAGGRLDEACAIYRRILDQIPDQPTALYLLGVAALQRNDLANAVSLIGRGVIGEPRNADAWSHLGIALHRAGKLEDGLAALGRCLQLSPDHPGATIERAMVLSDMGRAEDSLAAYDAIVARDPRFFAGQLNRANLLFRMERLSEAAEGFRAAVAAKPEEARAHNNLAVTLRALGRHPEALEAFESALACDAKFPAAETGRGIVLAELARFEEAILAFDRAIQIDPADAGAHFNRGLSLLTLGRWGEGWPEYEWRWRLAENPSKPRNFSQPVWDGRRLADRPLLLHAEQGVGDAINFLRYAALAKARGARVIVECQATLKRLLERSPGIDLLVARGEALPAFEWHAPLMSLPRMMGTHPTAIPAPERYIFADPADIARRREQLAAIGAPRIGLVWQGNMQNRYLRGRSTDLLLWARLLQHKELAFVSLQVDPGRGQLGDLAAADRPFDPFTGAPPRDFADTAAIIAHLDMVISVDTAVAHLAAAMGQARLGDPALFRRLALGPRRRDHPLVSDDAAVPPAPAGRLG